MGILPDNHSPAGWIPGEKMRKHRICGVSGYPCFRDSCIRTAICKANIDRCYDDIWPTNRAPGEAPAIGSTLYKIHVIFWLLICACIMGSVGGFVFWAMTKVLG